LFLFFFTFFFQNKSFFFINQTLNEWRTIELKEEFEL